MGKLFGTDGIRGVAGIELTNDLARLVGRALIHALPKCDGEMPDVVIGMDTRLSSAMLADSVAEGICYAGGNATVMGVCSTPAVAYTVVNEGYDAGVMISASHNPWEYNGIKIFGSDGFKLSDELEDRIEELLTVYDDSLLERAEKMGAYTFLPNGTSEYADYIVRNAGGRLDGLRIAIDCANGSASETAEEIFSSLGAECVMLASSPDGMNINRDCGSTHIDMLREAVVRLGLDAGIAFDGDADRCLAIDERGCDVDGDHIIAILAEALMEKNKLRGGCVVGTVMTNLGLVRFCEARGIGFKAAKVGDRYVLEILNKEGLSLGGEQSGHIILRDISTTGDGQLTAACLLAHMKKSGKSLSALASVMKKYPQYMINVKADAKEKSLLTTDEVIKKLILDCESDMGDAGRILIRPSGTEPLIRVMTEGQSPDLAESVCRRLAEGIEARLGELK